MIQRGKMPAVMNQGITDTERSRPDITRAMHPVRINISGRRRSNVNVNVGTVTMLDQTAVQDIGTLVRCNRCLRMDTEMQVLEVVNPVTQTLMHRRQEATQVISFAAAVYLRNATILNGKLDWLTEVRRYPNVP